MIKDNIKNAEIYYNLSENIKKGLLWLKQTDLKKIPCGRYEIENDNIFANIQEYKTKLDAKYEAHRKYIDIQFVVSGNEKVGVTDIENCLTCEDYNPETDLEFFNLNQPDEYCNLKDNEFLILFPHDAHKPSISPDDITDVKKVVIKVAL